jgi:hypothetical protein
MQYYPVGLQKFLNRCLHAPQMSRLCEAKVCSDTGAVISVAAWAVCAFMTDHNLLPCFFI